MHGAHIEVQLPTIFERAFNFISRVSVYKSEQGYSADWRKKFVSLSTALAQLDESALAVHAEVVESSARGTRDAPLSPLSYREIIQQEFGENLSIEDAVD